MKKTIWPDNAPFAVCPTHDVDRIHKCLYHYLYYGVSGNIRTFQAQFNTLVDAWHGQDPFWNFDAIMDFENSLGVRSTFLFLNETVRGFSPKFWGRYDINAPNIKKIIRELDQGGWEIGLHGSYFSFNDKRMLGEEKKTLEDIVNKPVKSTRQHYLNLAPSITWKIQRELGLDVDSSVGYSDRIWNVSDGILPYIDDNSEILELPITVMDTLSIENVRVCSKIEAVIEKIALDGGLIVLDWHQCAFNQKEAPERVALYKSILRDGRAEGAWIATMGEIADYWKSVETNKL